MRATDADKIAITIVVLSHNRRGILSGLLEELSCIRRSDVEVMVVDNGSHDGTADMIRERFGDVRLVALGENLGAVGRNRGISLARGRYIVTIDDDILGLDDAALDNIQNLFERDQQIGAICFKVIDHSTGNVCNWCHPNRPEDSAERSFQTTEIPEGAVAFRTEMLGKTGLYTEDFFISHEGADLAARILNMGYRIYYSPLICVKHKYADIARDKWRRYYYDTRNDFWLVIRNYRFYLGINHLLRRLPATFIYSVRDGYLRFWVKAVGHALVELPRILRQRQALSVEADRKMRYLNRGRPGLAYYFQKRFPSKQVRI